MQYHEKEMAKEMAKRFLATKYNGEIGEHADAKKR